MSKHMYSTANLSDVELKEQGNRLFSAKKFDDAIGCYTKAIVSIWSFIVLRFRTSRFVESWWMALRMHTHSSEHIIWCELSKNMFRSMKWCVCGVCFDKKSWCHAIPWRIKCTLDVFAMNQLYRIKVSSAHSTSHPITCLLQFSRENFWFWCNCRRAKAIVTILLINSSCDGTSHSRQNINNWIITIRCCHTNVMTKIHSDNNNNYCID